jgi:hypothetical protein
MTFDGQEREQLGWKIAIIADTNSSIDKKKNCRQKLRPNHNYMWI